MLIIASSLINLIIPVENKQSIIETLFISNFEIADSINIKYFHE